MASIIEMAILVAETAKLEKENPFMGLKQSVFEFTDWAQGDWSVDMKKELTYESGSTFACNASVMNGLINRLNTVLPVDNKLKPSLAIYSNLYNTGLFAHQGELTQMQTEVRRYIRDKYQHQAPLPPQREEADALNFIESLMEDDFMNVTWRFPSIGDSLEKKYFAPTALHPYFSFNDQDLKMQTMLARHLKVLRLDGRYLDEEGETWQDKFHDAVGDLFEEGKLGHELAACVAERIHIDQYINTKKLNETNNNGGKRKFISGLTWEQMKKKGPIVDECEYFIMDYKEGEGFTYALAEPIPGFKTSDGEFQGGFLVVELRFGINGVFSPQKTQNVGINTSFVFPSPYLWMSEQEQFKN